MDIEAAAIGVAARCVRYRESFRLVDIMEGFMDENQCAARSEEFPFFAMLDRMQYINRWGLMRNNKTENIKEHSMDVAMVAQALAVIRGAFFPNDGRAAVDPHYVVALALFHDATEIITGDLPTPIKYKNPEITKTYKEIEGQAANTLLGLLPEEMRSFYRGLLLPESTGKANAEACALVKAADKVCAYTKCVIEETAGNREFSVAKESLLSAVEACHLPEVDYFMTHFLPSYGQTLDQISR